MSEAAAGLPDTFFHDSHALGQYSDSNNRLLALTSSAPAIRRQREMRDERSGMRDERRPTPPHHSHHSSSARRLTVVFQRNPEHDGQRERIRFEGYKIAWPNGEAVTVGLHKFCQQGSRLILGRRMQAKNEQLVELGVHPVADLEAPLTRLDSGIRTRRFFLIRQAGRAQVFFFNGSPTEVFFDAEQDDPRVLAWLGVDAMKDGDQVWFDLSARSLAS